MNGSTNQKVTCPVCSRQVLSSSINSHLDTGCTETAASKPALSQSLSPLFKTHKFHRSSPPPEQILPTPSSSNVRQKRRADPPVEPQASKRQKPSISGHLSAAAPLADRLRPQTLKDFIGQPHLTGPDSLLASSARNGELGSLILWGPPGCGKTTLARLLAAESNAIFKELSATIAGINDVRAVFEEAKKTLVLTGRRTILFLDEVHRFNKSQQDIFLPFVEQGHIQLIGATTENPSFKLTGSLLSRCRVFTLERLTDMDIEAIVTHAVQRVSADGGSAIQPLSPISSPVSSPESERLPGPPFPSYPQLTRRVLTTIVGLASGDARSALGLVELVLNSSKLTPESVLLSSLKGSVSISYSRTGDDRYDLISALHKSVRGGQTDAALYWLARMLTAGEDPIYIARRMVVCASEDIGLADEKALPLAVAAIQACQLIGMPECRINLAHLVSYLAGAKKDTRSYEGYARAETKAKETPTLPVPMCIRNAPTPMMGEMGYGKDYRYNPDFQHPVTNEYLPPRLQNERFFRKLGDVEGKIWDEEALKEWEAKENGGKPWEGRVKR